MLISPVALNEERERGGGPKFFRLSNTKRQSNTQKFLHKSKVAPRVLIGKKIGLIRDCAVSENTQHHFKLLLRNFDKSE